MNIVILTGGTAGRNFAKGLSKHLKDNPFNDYITLLVNTTDNGGHSGKIRNESGIIPVGDLRQILTAFFSYEIDLFLNERDRDGKVGGNNELGEKIQRLGVKKGIDEFVLKYGGLPPNVEVLPISENPTDLCLETWDGKIYYGQWEIIKRPPETQIKEFYLQPPVSILKEAKEALEKADIIIISPSALVTSILPILLVKGVKEIIKSKYLVWFLPLFTLPSEKNYSAEFYWDLLVQYAKIPELIIVNNREIPREIIASYEKHGFYPIKFYSLPPYRLPYSIIVLTDLLPGIFPLDPPEFITYGEKIERYYIPLRHDSSKMVDTLIKLRLLGN